MSALGSLSLLAIAAFIVLLAAAAVNDVRRLTIPNYYCLGIVLCYPVYLLSPPQPVDWPVALLIAGGLLAVGFVLFTTGRVGGGDAKLLAAASLWAGPAHLMEYMLFTALAGGGMAILLYLHHRWSRSPSLAAFATTDAAPDFAQQPMPYGVAIFAGGVYVAFTLLEII